MDDKRKGMSQVWFILGIPPVLFLIVIIAISVYFGVITQGDAQAIAENTSSATPYIVLIVQVLLLLFLLRQVNLFRQDQQAYLSLDQLLDLRKLVFLSQSLKLATLSQFLRLANLSAQVLRAILQLVP